MGIGWPSIFPLGRGRGKQGGESFIAFSSRPHGPPLFAIGEGVAKVTDFRRHGGDPEERSLSDWSHTLFPPCWCQQERGQQGVASVRDNGARTSRHAHITDDCGLERGGALHVTRIYFR